MSIRRFAIGISVAFLLAFTGPLPGAPQAVGAQSSSAAPDLPRMSWKGYRGVRPGETLRHAAEHLGVPIDKHCEFYWYVHAGHGVYMTDSLMRSRHVEWMYPLRGKVRGPLGIHSGMKLSQLKTRASDAHLKIHKYFVTEAGSYGHWIRRSRHGAVLAFTKGYYDVSAGEFRPHALTWLGLTRNLRTAKQALDNQGGC